MRRVVGVMEKELEKNILESFGFSRGYPLFTVNDLRKECIGNLQVENYYCKLKNKEVIIDEIDKFNLPHVLKMNFINSLEKYSRRLGANVNGTFFVASNLAMKSVAEMKDFLIENKEILIIVDSRGREIKLQDFFEIAIDKPKKL